MVIVVAESGERKSASSNDIWTPVLKYVARQNEIFRECKRGLKLAFDKLNRDIAKRTNAGNQSDGATPRELRELDELERRCRPPVHLSDDATTAALLRAMHSNHGCVSLFSTDAVKLMANFAGEMNQGRVDDSLALKGFSGDRIVLQRVTDDVCLSIEAPWVSLYACFTGATLRPLLDNTILRRDGFFPRLLPWMEGGLPARSRMENLDRARRIPQGVRDSWEQLLLPCLARYRDYWVQDVERRDNGWRRLKRDAEPHVVDMNDSAVVRRFAEHGDRFDLHGDRIDLHGDRIDAALRSFAVRREEYAQRLALLIHLAQHGERAHEFPLHEWTAWAGCAIDSACYRQWRGLFAEEADAQLAREGQCWRERVAKLGGGGAGPVGVRDLYSKYGLRPDELLEILGRHRQVFEIFKEPAGAQGGRPRTLVRIKPAALSNPSGGVVGMPPLPGGGGSHAAGV